MGVIFDLDQTLVDSSCLEQLRQARRWGEVYQLLTRTRVYDGIVELLERLSHAEVPMCIVTSSPRSYCERVVKHHALPIYSLVCYHDTIKHKPSPEPIQLGLARLATPPAHTYALGDAVADIIAANAAGVISVACLWGASTPDELRAVGPNIVCRTVSDVAHILHNAFIRFTP